MPGKKRALDLTYIQWRDAAGMSGGGWQHTEDMDQLEPRIIDSIGWVYREEKDFVVLASHVEVGQMNFEGDMCIPKSAIIKRCSVHIKDRK